jgi:DNA-binding transcriptional LysR family regulator
MPMATRIDWDRQIGRRLKLRDLHVFLTVAHRGSMAKAAAELGVSQPVISAVVAGLENAIGVRLFDRSPRGVEPTPYGRALLKGGMATFDDLKQTIQEIEFLADPTAGEVRIGCPETVAAILTPVIRSLMQRYPGLVVHVTDVVAPTLELPLLCDRTIDLALVRVARAPARHHFGTEDLNAEVLFNDELVVVAGLQSKWARRRKLDLDELLDEPWILPPPHTLNSTIVMDAFRSRGPKTPKVRLVTYSVQLRIDLVADGSFITTLPLSMMNVCADRFALKILPVKLPVRQWPVVLATLKNRTLNPVAQLFIASLRQAFRSPAVPSINSAR